MANAITVDVVGVKELYQKLSKLAGAATADRVIGKATALVESTAKHLVPVDTSALRNSIATKVERRGGDTVGIVFTPLEYGLYVEFGTGIHSTNKSASTWQDGSYHKVKTKAGWRMIKGTRAQPFMRPALKQNLNKITRLFEDEISAALRS